jgi:hypothetical protein
MTVLFKIRNRMLVWPTDDLKVPRQSTGQADRPVLSAHARLGPVHLIRCDHLRSDRLLRMNPYLLEGLDVVR